MFSYISLTLLQLLIFISLVTASPISTISTSSNVYYIITVTSTISFIALCLFIWWLTKRYNDDESDTSSIPEAYQRHLQENEIARQSFELARAFESTHPYGSLSTEITPEQMAYIQEKGVFAWEFVFNDEVNALVQEKTEILFLGGESCLQTNLPIPKQNSVYYFEVKFFEKPNDTNIGVGLATKPFPAWRFPGQNRHSAGYHANDGIIYHNTPYKGMDTEVLSYEGDIIGVGYQPRTGTIFFTRNGKKFGSSITGMFHDLFPTVASDGPSRISVNFGQLGFVYIEANVKKWGLAPVEGSLSPPPTYGNDDGSVLLESSSMVSPRPQSTPPTLSPQRFSSSMDAFPHHTALYINQSIPSRSKHPSYKDMIRLQTSLPEGPPPAYSKDDPNTPLQSEMEFSDNTPEQSSSAPRQNSSGTDDDVHSETIHFESNSNDTSDADEAQTLITGNANSDD